MAPGWSEVRAALSSRPPGRVSEAVRARAAVALILQEGASGLELLFIRRSEHPLDPWSGHMAFPGGRQDRGDQSLLDTAVRETLEEIGVDLGRDAESLGALDELAAMARMRPVSLAITPHVFRLLRAVPTTPNAEVESVHWLPLARLLDPAARSTHAHVHDGVTLRFPCLRDGAVEIWGLTYRMFEELAERLGASTAEAKPVVA